MSAIPMRAETPDEIALLLLFRSLTAPQQKAFLKLVKAMATFRAAMQDGQREAA